MRITVHVKANARIEKVEKMSQNSLGLENSPSEKTIYKVSVKEPPVDGKANDAVIRLLAEYFGIPKSLVTLVSGHTYKQKVFDISSD